MNTTSPITLEINRGFVYAGLERVFAAEWLRLTSADQEKVFQDVVTMSEREDCTLNEYQRRIGRDNLQSYANCL